MAVLNPDHLLDQAERLMAVAGVGAPRHADLRRAISTAYYGVFHAVATAAADDVAGSTQRDAPRYALVYRSIEHRRLLGVCEDIVKTTPSQKHANYLPTGGLGPDIIAVATAVKELQKKRVDADYDPLFRVTTSDAVLAIEMGRNAIARLKAANRAQRKTFLSLVLFPPR